MECLQVLLSHYLTAPHKILLQEPAARVMVQPRGLLQTVLVEGSARLERKRLAGHKAGEHKAKHSVRSSVCRKFILHSEKLSTRRPETPGTDFKQDIQ